MRLKRNSQELPSIIVIPMIDIMFFLLVFFMLSTMYMTNLQAVPVRLTEMEGGQMNQDVAFAVSVDDKGGLFIGDIPVDLQTLQAQAQEELRRNPNAAIVLRVDAQSPYEKFSQVVETLKSSGVSRFAIASEAGG